MQRKREARERRRAQLSTFMHNDDDANSGKRRAMARVSVDDATETAEQPSSAPDCQTESGSRSADCEQSGSRDANVVATVQEPVEVAADATLSATPADAGRDAAQLQRVEEQPTVDTDAPSACSLAAAVHVDDAEAVAAQQSPARDTGATAAACASEDTMDEVPPLSPLSDTEAGPQVVSAAASPLPPDPVPSLATLEAPATAPRDAVETTPVKEPDTAAPAAARPATPGSSSICQLRRDLDVEIQIAKGAYALMRQYEPDDSMRFEAEKKLVFSKMRAQALRAEIVQRESSTGTGTAALPITKRRIRSPLSRLTAAHAATRNLSPSDLSLNAVRLSTQPNENPGERGGSGDHDPGSAPKQANSISSPCTARIIIKGADAVAVCASFLPSFLCVVADG